MGRKPSAAIDSSESSGLDSVMDGNIGDARSDSGIDALESLNGIPVVDPALFGGNDGSDSNADANNGTAKRGRGRPKGGGNSGGRTTQKDKAVSVTGIEKLLLSTHNMLARLTKVDEMKLDNDEAKMIAEAVANVQQYYNTSLDPKYLAWAGLIGVCVTIYGPRTALLVMSKRNSKKNDKEAPSNVVQHRPVAVQPFDPSAFSSKSGGM